MGRPAQLQPEKRSPQGRHLRKDWRFAVRAKSFALHWRSRGFFGVTCAVVRRVYDLHPGQPIAMDVCVASELVNALAETAANHPGHAAEVAPRAQEVEACLRSGWPRLAIEDYGALGKDLQALIWRCNQVALGMPIAGTTWAASSFATYLRQRITVCLRRVSATITARPPQHNTTGPRHRAFDLFLSSCYRRVSGFQLHHPPPERSASRSSLQTILCYQCNGMPGGVRSQRGNRKI